MGIIGEHMTKHHRECDDTFTRAEDRASASDWAGVEREGRAFLDAMERHIEIEESLLFPAFEQKTGMLRGPTRIMRVEHTELRRLFERMREAIAAEDQAAYDEAARAVRELLQLHNSKEESMLYPMLDQALRNDAQALLAQVEAATA